MKPTLIVINNHGGRLMPSETFLQSHLDLLPQPLIPLIGARNHRILVNEGMKPLTSQSMPARAGRRIVRTLGLSSLERQDTSAITQLLLARQIGVVMAEYGPTACSVLDACQQSGVPLVPHFHGFDAYKTDVVERYRSQYELLFQYAAAIIAVSTHMKAQLCRLGAPAEKIFINPCGASIDPNCRASPATAPERFIMVGRLVEKKAPTLTLRAFAEAARKHPSACLDIVGDGPLLEQCRKLSIDLRVAENVIFHGALPHSRVLSLMQTGRCFVQHSVQAPDGDHEGTPVSVVEASATGLPVVATRHGGIPEIIREDKTGYLVDEGDVDGMARHMLNYLENPELAAAHGESGRQHVAAHHTTEISVSRLSTVLDRVRLR